MTLPTPEPLQDNSSRAEAAAARATAEQKLADAVSRQGEVHETLARLRAVMQRPLPSFTGGTHA